MAGRLDKPSTTTSSTGGTTSVDQAKGITTNRASANNPNRLAATAAGGTGTFPGEDPKGPGYVGRREVARRQAARDAEAAKKPAAPNFAPQGGGYKSVNYAPNIKTGINLPKPTAPAAPTATNVTSTYGPGFKNSNQPAVPKEDPQAEIKKAIAARQAAGLGAYESKTNGSRILQALKRPVAEMLQMVETKEDVQRIKQFVDDTFIKYGAVNESAFAVRNQIIEHVTQAGAQRRREHSRRVAH